ncbi:DUF2279 domain-containing protein [Persicobacter psychrovividus]|uniref:DUF2279 domain-containing protein n=1 Tax=Persicobacter psychrovividus TaxID=387638 RepID=A0ABM7VGB1_9BACT|nr:DUF2279 domain-containing protein [Persicobacter psychrovividus]
MSAQYWWVPLLLFFIWVLLQVSKRQPTTWTAGRGLLYFVIWYVLMIAGLGLAWYGPQGVSSFHFFNDLDEWYGMDKLGHFFTCFQMVRWAEVLLKKGGWDRQKRQSVAYLLGLLILLPVEVLDGFGRAYGFSVYDLLANAAGASFAYLQLRFWGKVKMFPRFSFFPSAWAEHRPQLLGQHLGEQVLKDYNGQVYWMSYPVRYFINRKSVPSWLMCSIGYQVEGMVYGRVHQNLEAGYKPYNSLLFSFDIDYAQLPLRRLQRVKLVLELFKLPMPTLEVRENGHWQLYWVYF